MQEVMLYSELSQDVTRKAKENRDADRLRAGDNGTDSAAAHTRGECRGSRNGQYRGSRNGQYRGSRNGQYRRDRGEHEKKHGGAAPIDTENGRRAAGRYRGERGYADGRIEALSERCIARLEFGAFTENIERQISNIVHGVVESYGYTERIESN